MKILTISIAAYNAENTIKKCLDSLVNNNVCDDLDIIVVDDGSIDTTSEIAHSYEKKYPNSVRVVNKKNGGHGSTINKSIELAKGRYYRLVDADDWVEKDGIESLVSELKIINSDIVMNPYFEVNALTGAKALCKKALASNIVGKEISVDELDGATLPEMHSICYKTKILKQYDCKITENCFYVDTEYLVYYLSKCKTAMILTYPVYDYLLGTDTQSVNFSVMTKRRSQQAKVSLACLRYWVNHKESIESVNLCEILRRRIVSYIVKQFILLLSLQYSDSKIELKLFVEQLKEILQENYRSFVKAAIKDHVTTVRLVDLIDRTGYILLKPINTIYREKFVR